MAKTKKVAKKKNGFTIPIALVGGFAVPAATLLNHWNAYHDPAVTARELGQFFTGYDYTTGKWDMYSLRFGLLPVLVGGLAHKLAGKFGINGMLARAGVPWLRV